jgi:hypothetical protein
MLVNAGATRIIKLPMIAVTNSNSTSVKAAALPEDSDESPITDNVRAREPLKADFRFVVEAAPKAFGAGIMAKVDLIFPSAVFGRAVMSDMILQIQENLLPQWQKAGESGAGPSFFLRTSIARTPLAVRNAFGDQRKGAVSVLEIRNAR